MCDRPRVVQDDGEAVLAAATTAAGELLADELVAVYALGSLAHGGFAPLVSDVDVAVVTARADAGAARRVGGIGERVRARDPGRLADRLSVFWADPDGVRTGPGRFGRLGPVDRCDLLESGRLLAGTDVRGGARPPDAAELVRATARFGVLDRLGDDALDRLSDAGALVEAGARPLTKAVLFPVRFLYTLRHGRVATNPVAAGAYTGPGTPLVTAAMRWRDEGVTDPVRARLLVSAHLLGLYAEFLDACAGALDPGADGDLVAVVRERRDRLR